MKQFIIKSILKIVLISTVSFSLGCNFFGSKKDETTAQPVGSLSSGISILGVWTTSYASESANRNPGDLYTATYTFDTQLSFKISLKDPHQGGIECIAMGSYKIINNDILMFVSGINNSMCGFTSQYHFINISADKFVMKMTEMSSNSEMTLFQSLNPQSLNLVGVWDFHSQGADQNGDGGIDWIYFDSNGYFLVQTKYSGVYYIMKGFYSISDTNAVTMAFFTERPDYPEQSGMYFDQFITSGNQLALSFDDGNGGFTSYTGDRL